MNGKKKWFASKTLWANIIAIAAIVIAAQTGHTLTAEAQVTILGVVNILLRIITKEQLEW